MREYIGNEDSMKMIMDQLIQNPLMEIANIRTQNGVLSGWSEDINMNRLSWDGDELQNGDMVYFREQGVIFIVKIRVNRHELYSDELAMGDVEAHAYSVYADRKKAKKEAEICSGPDCSKIFDNKGYNVGAF